METIKKKARLLKLTKLLILFIYVALLSCSSSQNLSKKQNLVSHGQTREEVLKVFGTPENKQFNGLDEAWQYCDSGSNSDIFVIIWFYDGKVTGMKSYKQSGWGPGRCTQYFRTINWEDAPDRPIEIKN